MVSEIGIELLTKEQYYYLQSLGDFDTKISSWMKAHEDVRKRGSALFGDFRFGWTFIYHNGARGYRGCLKV
jgi:hypothetical protein